MNILEINPYIRRSMRSELPAMHQINRRIILDYELLYIENGELQLTYNDKDFFCPKGSILLICPNIPHSFHVLKENLSQPHIHFDLKYDFQSENVFICYRDYCDLTQAEIFMIRENAFPQLKDSPFLKISDKKTFLKIFYDIINTKENHSLICKTQMLRLLQFIISENAPESTSVPSVNPQIAPLIKSYIDSNYSQKISLSVLERQFNFSRFYIEKLFKQEYGISVISYRNTKRMEAAVCLLCDHSVSETAHLLGYSSIYTFSQAFRNTYGVSPTKYKVRKTE